jgi:hypothetical protein
MARPEGLTFDVHGCAYVGSPEELGLWSDWYGTRDSWHEPDEQGLRTAELLGDHLDNAMGVHPNDRYAMEQMHRYAEHRLVVRDDDGRAVLVVNLASLFGWASAAHRDRDRQRALREVRR